MNGDLAYQKGFSLHASTDERDVWGKFKALGTEDFDTYDMRVLRHMANAYAETSTNPFHVRIARRFSDLISAALKD